MKIYLLFVLVFFISCSNGKLSSDEMTQANSLYQHGKLLEKEGKADSAVIYYRKSLSLLDKSNEYHLTATVYNQLGELLCFHRYYDRAIELHKKALKYGLLLEDKSCQSNGKSTAACPPLSTLNCPGNSSGNCPTFSNSN